MVANYVGENLRKLRENVGLNQTSLAGFLGVDQSYISKVEKGERAISSDMLEKLAALFGVSTESFERGEIEPTKLSIAYHERDLTNEDMEAICAVNNIALNLDFLSGLAGEEQRD
ncbi:MAG: helix-turn-helix transcriptional regulator [Clostridia bacterium]|nr:helix-turn-helix transcriptional regulator [Clostridia bacterium]